MIYTYLYLFFFPFLVLGIGIVDKSSSTTPTLSASSIETKPTTELPITVRVVGTILMALNKTNCTDGDKISYRIILQGVPSHHPVFGETRIQIFSSSVPDFSYDVTSIVTLIDISNFENTGTFVMNRSGEVFIGCALCFREQCSQPISIQNQSSVSIEVTPNPPSSVQTPFFPTTPSLITETIQSKPTYVRSPPKLPPTYPTNNGIVKSEEIAVKASLILIFLTFMYYLV